MSNALLSSHKRFIAYVLLAFFLFQQGNAVASQVSTADILNQLDQSTPFFNTQQRQALQQSIITKMRQAGVSNNEVEQRIAALSDSDLQLLQSNFDQETAGGDIIGVAVFVFLVLLVTDILGFTDIFPFVNHGHHHPRGHGHQKHTFSE